MSIQPYDPNAFVPSDDHLKPPVALVTSRPDRDVADDLKRRLREALDPVLQVLDDSRAAGFVPMFNLGLDNLGRSRVTELALVKHF